MPAWLWIFVILGGGLFAVKMTYVLCTAMVLPATQGATFVSTSRKRISSFMDAVPMETEQLLVDIGCGDGRALRMAQKRYGVRAVGYELNLLAYLKARLQCLGIKGVEIRRSNFWRIDLSGADVVFCYLFPDVMKALSEKLRSELQPGSIVVSCNFALPGFCPTRVLRPDGTLHNDPIYIYRMGETVSAAEKKAVNGHCRFS
ncbi:SAM-dependent methyltransferase [Thermodesulfobacteriota bacterium]